jgi:hypothetical protein
VRALGRWCICLLSALVCTARSGRSDLWRRKHQLKAGFVSKFSPVHGMARGNARWPAADRALRGTAQPLRNVAPRTRSGGTPWHAAPGRPRNRQSPRHRRVSVVVSWRISRLASEEASWTGHEHCRFSPLVMPPRSSTRAESWRSVWSTGVVRFDVQCRSRESGRLATQLPAPATGPLRFGEAPNEALVSPACLSIASSSRWRWS